MTTDRGWFAGVDPAEDGEAALDAGVASVRDGSTDAPADWPAIAVETGFADDEAAYYDLLHETTMAATRAAVEAAERADDQQLIHRLRAMDDCDRTANELAERVAEWAGSLGVEGSGLDLCRRIASRAVEASSDAQLDEALVDLATRAVDLDEQAEALRTDVERTAPAVAPNLAALAGPVLAARLLSLAGGLEDLARSSSSTLQVLGAEDALFAHLRGQGPSPKHGVIFTHEYVAGTDPEHRGSAARALAGKLTLAARVDHYSGERKPELDDQLEERMERIRARSAADADRADANGADDGEPGGDPA